MRAVVFDMDGVIVDSEHQWKLAEGPLLRRFVPAWRDQDNDRIVGFGVEDLHRFLAAEFGLAAPKETFLAACHELAADIYRRRATRAEGLLEVLDGLARRRVPLALASSSPRSWIGMVLERFELAPRFQAVASADDVGGRGKPSPEIHLLAARRLGVPPGECLAIEDSRVGVAAAKAAGMRCAGFRNGHNDEQDLSLADLELRGFGALDLSGF